MTDKTPEYDKIGKQYKLATKRPLRRYAYEPTIGLYLPSLKGKRILDLACGDGVVTRMMRDAGASELVGLDLSQEMIDLASAQDSDKITYAKRDCMKDDLTDFGKFDLTTGMMFLHYASNRKDLENTVKNIKDSLKENGTFCGMLVNPDLVLKGHDRYGVNIPFGDKKEGKQVKIELTDFEGNKFCDVKDYFWKRETFEGLFQKYGFSTEWLPGIVSQEGLDQYGKEFWKDYLENPIYVMIKAKLK